MANKTAESLDRIVEGAMDTTRLIEEVTIASSGQAISINQITTGVDQIAMVIQTNSAASEESAAASEELSSQANLMKTLVNNFKFRDSDNEVQGSMINKIELPSDDYPSKY